MSFSLLRALGLSLLSLSACANSSPENHQSEPTKTAKATPAKPPLAPAATPDAATKHAAVPAAVKAVETFTFASEDGLPITADLYLQHAKDAPFIVLFHQAGWSRGEYQEIAPRLVELGFNCMAVDQRSGGAINGVVNRTKKAAVAKKLQTRYIDALPDMRAALHYLKTTYPKAKRIAWGSSYSSALVLVLAGQHPELVDAVLAFSPGEYFARYGKSKLFVTKEASAISVPVFITSAKSEASEWKEILAAIPSKRKTGFLPKTAGKHGSRALWSVQPDAVAYWDAVIPFLKSI